MSDKPCSEIAKEILTKVPRGTFTKSRKDFIAERIIQALQSERTAREEAEKDLKWYAEEHEPAAVKLATETLQAEIERLKDLRKSYPTDHSAEEITALRSKVEELQSALATDKDKPCPFVVTSDEGTSYCELAESKSQPDYGEEHSCGKSRRLVETLKEKDAEIGKLKSQIWVLEITATKCYSCGENFEISDGKPVAYCVNCEDMSRPTRDECLAQCDKQEAQLQAQADLIERYREALKKYEAHTFCCDKGIIAREALALPLPSSSKRFEAMREVVAAAKDVVSQFPFVYGEPVPAWVSNLKEKLDRLEAES